MTVDPVKGNSYSKKEAEAGLSPKVLQNGSVTQSDLKQHVSNGKIVPKEGSDSTHSSGLRLDVVTASAYTPDESELFNTTSPASPVVVEVFPEDEESEILARFNLSQQIDKILNRNRYIPKICYTVSIASIIFLTYCLFYEQWLIPYYYTISMPCLMLIRLIMYTKLKYQYFMLDLCYFVNTAMMIYIWAFPDEREFATVLFSFNAGPCGLATILFRNSLVLHSLDKMTSAFLHVIPMFVCFAARWYPEQLNEYWYTNFTTEFNTDWDYWPIWLWAVPMAFHIAHMFLYLCLIRIVFRPGDDHDYSFRYLSGLSGSSGGCPRQCITCCNHVSPENIQFMYCVMTIVYGAIGFVFVPFWYTFFIGHCLFLGFVFFVVTWNGSRYYLDVFGPKVFK